MSYTLPKLPYAYDALEPYIDAQTMEIHHTKHHQGYIDNLNVAIEKYPELINLPLAELLKNLNVLKVDEADRSVIRNHGGGHANHSFFWQLMGPEKQIDEGLQKEIIRTFDSLEIFKEKFTQSALTRFGSGWAWLVRNSEGKLEIYSTTNQDSPYLQGHTPLIGVDVWEHAYYLKYQNRRPEYITNWWNVLKLL
jgi:Fe-Mn family superoxide dismutase